MEELPYLPNPTSFPELKDWTENRGKRLDQYLKEKWSEYIYDLVFLTIIFQIGLTTAIGLGWLSFEKYDYLLYMVIGENFLQMIGMGYIVANHLFPNNNKAEKSR